MKISMPAVSSKDILKVLLIGNFVITVLMSGLLGILSLFKLVPVNFNEKEYIGITGFLISILYIPIITIAMTLPVAFIALSGFWIAKKLFK